MRALQSLSVLGRRARCAFRIFTPWTMAGSPSHWVLGINHRERIGVVSGSVGFQECVCPALRRGRIVLPVAQGGTRGSQFSHRLDRRRTGCADDQPAQGEADWINCPPRGAKPRCDASRPRAASSRQSEASIPPCRRVCGWTRRRFAGWAIASHPTAQNRLINKFGPDVAWTLEGLSSAFVEMMPFAATDATEPAESAAKAGELTASATTVAHGKLAHRAQLTNPHGS